MVEDIKRSVDFFTSILDFKLHRIATDGKFAIILFGKSILMLTEGDVPKPKYNGLEEIRFLVKDVDLVYEEIKERGGEIEDELEDQEYGLRTFFVKNPDGLRLKFSSPI